jgi:hypothetical protein
MSKHLLAAALFLLPLAVFADTAWKDYTNPRFGFKISHPSTLLLKPEPTNGQGREFYTKDKEFYLAAYGHFLIDDDSLDKRWSEELKQLGKYTTYKKKEKSWYVVSGVKDGEEFYNQTHVKDGNWVTFRITYPHDKARQYDPWVEKIAKSFVPFLKGDYDRIVK